MKRKGSSPEREFRGSAQRRSEEWEEDPIGHMYDDEEEEEFEDQDEEFEEEEDEDDPEDEEEDAEDEEEESDEEDEDI
jgi:hypothetical protein